MNHLFVSFSAIFAVQMAFAAKDCSSTFKSKGCYYGVNKVLKHEILVNDRDGSSGKSVDWFNFPAYLNGLVCRCQTAAKDKGYTMFGIRFWGECWGYKGDENQLTSLSRGLCDNGNYKECKVAGGDKFCTGRYDTTFVYKIETSSLTPDFPYPTKDCASAMHNSDGDTLNASLPYLTGSRYCRAFLPVPARLKEYTGNYVIRAEMLNTHNDKGEEFGSGGLMFNVQDMNNFQFAFVSLNKNSQCYEYGVVREGKVDPWFYNFGSCTRLYWDSKRWNAVMIHLTDDGARFSVNGHELVKMRNFLPKKGKGGILTKNGEHNVVTFKNYHSYQYNYTDIVKAEVSKKGLPGQ